MQLACPELKTEQLHSFINTLLEKENYMHNFSTSVKGGSVNDRYDFKMEISQCHLSEEILSLDYLNPQTIKEVSRNAMRAKINADKNPTDYEKEVIANDLRINEIRLKRLHKTLTAAEAAGISFDKDLLKKAIRANSNAESADIGDYNRSESNIQLITDSKDMIITTVKNMGRANVTPQSYPENKTVSWNNTIRETQKTL